MSFLPDRAPDDTAKPDRGIRLPSWDAPPPPPPRRWTGPCQYGYPRIRRDPLDELAQGLARTERRIAALEDRLDELLAVPTCPCSACEP